MAPNQQRTGEKAKPYPISLYPSTVEELREIHELTGESMGSVVRRLVEAEITNLRQSGVPVYEVLTFPSYFATGSQMATTVIYRRSGAADLVIHGVGERLKPTPDIGSFVLIKRPYGDDLQGRLARAEIEASDDENQMMTLTVDALRKPRSEQDDETRADAYKNWIETIFASVGRRVNHPVPPTGSDRKIGPYRIANTGPLTNQGDVGWTVMILHPVQRLSRRLIPVRWDRTDPQTIAEQIVAVIRELESEYPEHFNK